MATICQTTFSSAFCWMKMLEFRIKFDWSLFLFCRIHNIPSLVQIMAWRQPGDRPLSEPMMVSSLTHICVTRPQWVNNQLVLQKAVMWMSTKLHQRMVTHGFKIRLFKNLTHGNFTIECIGGNKNSLVEWHAMKLCPLARLVSLWIWA